MKTFIALQTSLEQSLVAVTTILLLTGCPSGSNDMSAAANSSPSSSLDGVPGCDSNGNSGNMNPHCVVAPTPFPSTLHVSRFFNAPRLAGDTGNITFDSKGNLYYADVNGYVIEKITPDGAQSVFAGSGINAYIDGVGTDASFFVPLLVTTDAYDNIFVIDGFQLRKISPSGVVSTIASLLSHSGTDGGRAFGLAVDKNSNTYVVWEDGGYNNVPPVTNIKKISPSGQVSVFAGSGIEGLNDGPPETAQFKEPRDLVIDSSGNLFVADTGNFLIRKISPSGVVSTFAGNGQPELLDGNGTTAGFSFYENYGHMSIDSSDNIFVGDMGAYTSPTYNTFSYTTIRKIDKSAQVSTFCGTLNPTTSLGSCSSSSAYSRFGVGVRNDGAVFFVDVGYINQIVFK